MRDDAIVKPNESNRKIYIIPNSDTMTREGQNALLKLLEEPPSYAMFFLLCENSADLLPTIRSRTQIYTLEQQNTFSDSVCEIAVAMAAALPSPAEAELLLAAAKETGAIVTAENHNVTCGLGSVVANCLAKNAPTIQEFVGVQDRFGQVGPQDFLMDEYGLRSVNIVAAVKKAISRK